jgi:hypothetical protein
MPRAAAEEAEVGEEEHRLLLINGFQLQAQILPPDPIQIHIEQFRKD